MSSTLGEKLRQAREERGISIAEVAEQTRISSLYLQSIENDDYKILPGGIFNKGFIKSYAKYVGIDEQEALQDYATLVASSESNAVDELRTYRPEVLTDDRASSSTVYTAVFAGIILALMSLGIWFVVNYIQNQQSEPEANLNATPVLSNANPTASNTNATSPQTDKISVELRAVGEPVWITYIVDGKSTIHTLAVGESLKADAADSFKLSFSKSKVANLQILLNGRRIEPPPPTKGNIELEINKGNVEQLMQGADVSANLPSSDESSPPANPAAVQTPVSTPRPRVDQPSPTPKPQSPTPRPAANTTPRGRPAATPIIVGNSTRRPG